MQTGRVLCMNLVLFWRRLLSRLQLLAILASICKDRSRKPLALVKKQALYLHLLRRFVGMCDSRSISSDKEEEKGTVLGRDIQITHSVTWVSISDPRAFQEWSSNGFCVLIWLASGVYVFFSVVCGDVRSILLLAGFRDKQGGQPWPGVPCWGGIEQIIKTTAFSSRRTFCWRSSQSCTSANLKVD